MYIGLVAYNIQYNGLHTGLHGVPMSEVAGSISGLAVESRKKYWVIVIPSLFQIPIILA